MRDHLREKNILVLNIVYIGFCLLHSLVLCLHSLLRTDTPPLQPWAVLPIPGPHSPASRMGMGSGPYFPGLGASAWMSTGDLIRGFPWDSYILNKERFSLPLGCYAGIMQDWSCLQPRFPLCGRSL